MPTIIPPTKPHEITESHPAQEHEKYPRYDDVNPPFLIGSESRRNEHYTVINDYRHGQHDTSHETDQHYRTEILGYFNRGKGEVAGRHFEEVKNPVEKYKADNNPGADGDSAFSDSSPEIVEMPQ